MDEFIFMLLLLVALVDEFMSMFMLVVVVVAGRSVHLWETTTINNIQLSMINIKQNFRVFGMNP